MHLIVYQCILCVYVFLWTICIEEVYILIYTPLLYVNYSKSIRYSWLINDCKLFVGYMFRNATQDKWKPTSVKFVTKEFSLPAYTNIHNIRWLLTNLKIVQLSMLQTQHVLVTEGVWQLPKSITCLSVNRSRLHSSVEWRSDAYSVVLNRRGVRLQRKSWIFPVSSQGRKCIIGNQVQTPVVAENVTVDWPDIQGKTRLALCRIISLKTSSTSAG